MSTAPILYLMMGLLFGTTLLALGIFLGIWIARRSDNDPNPPSQRTENTPSIAETQQLLSLLKSVAAVTTDFAGDFTRYQSTMKTLSRRAADGKTVTTREEVQGLLDQIVEANQHLQARLESAEVKLDNQTKQLAGYLSEARTDSLTGLANRRAFDQKIDECFQYWNQTKKLFSLALVDIDHFKKINDTHGHPAGDAVLREVACRLREYSGQTLQIARYGGEEFALLFETNLQDTARVMEQIRQEMSAKAIQAEGKTITVTLSCGVAEISRDDRIGKLIRRSDEALYTAKMAGRNRVFINNGILCEVFGNSAAETATVHVAEAATESPPSRDPLEERILKQIDSILAKENR